jgi:hypothetical protein
MSPAQRRADVVRPDVACAPENENAQSWQPLCSDDAGYCGPGEKWRI